MKPRLPIVRPEFFVLALFLAIAAAFVAVYEFALPEYYESTARVAVDRPLSTGPAHRTEAVSDFTRSDAVLLPVITNLQLNAKWAKRYGEPAPLRIEDTYPMLKKITKVTLWPNTTLVQIRVRSEDKMEAASIANEIASSVRTQTLQLDPAGKSESIQIVDVAEPGSRPMGRVAGSFFIGGGLIMFIEFFGLVALALLLTRIFVPAQRSANTL